MSVTISTISLNLGKGRGVGGNGCCGSCAVMVRCSRMGVAGAGACACVGIVAFPKDGTGGCTCCVGMRVRGGPQGGEFPLFFPFTDAEKGSSVSPLEKSFKAAL